MQSIFKALGYKQERLPKIINMYENITKLS